MADKEVRTIHISTSTIFRVLFVIAALFFLYFIRDILAIVFVAVLLAALIDPYANWLHQRRIPRALSVLLIYAVLLIVVGVVLTLIVPPLVEQVTQLINNFSSYYGELGDFIGRLRSFSETEGLPSYFTDSVASLQSGLSGAVSGVFTTLTGIFGGVATFIIILVLAFYMVVEEEAAKKFLKNLSPAEYQPFLSQLFTKMHSKVGDWLRGEIVIGFFVGLCSFVGLTILGVPYALVLALIAGMFELIPYAGPILASIPAIIIGFTVSPLMGLMVLVLYIVIQQIENNILYPKIMQKVTGLNPVVSIVALLIGIKVAGVVGALLAVPTALLVSVFVQSISGDLKKK